jgi:surface polysaccharide O-acyltransferase-like enzyme
MDNSKKSTYLFSIDALRVIAILAVLLIHTTTKTLATLNLDITLAPFSLFLNQAARFAVPLFFFISGFVLELNYREKLPYMTFFKRRAFRIIIPFIFWSVLYDLYLSNFSIHTLLTFHSLSLLVQGLSAYHLYFIPTLIIFYIAFPILHKFVNFLKNPYTLGVLVIVQLVLQFYDYYQTSLPFQYNLRVASLVYSMFILGIVASHYKNEIFRIIKRYIFILGIVSIILISFIYIHVTNITIKNGTSKYIYNQYGPLNSLYTAVFFTFFYYIFEKTQFLRNCFIQMSKLSFFVFFVHVLILHILWDGVIAQIIGKYGNDVITNIWFDPLLFVTLAVISFTIAYVVHKIPGASKITG